MESKENFRWWAGLLALIAGPLALLSLVVGLAGVDFDFEVFSDASALIGAGTAAAGNIKWSYYLNLLGNYLLLVPLALYLYAVFKPEAPSSSRLFTGGGMLYMLMGAIGSGIFAAAWPYLMGQYVTASPTEQAILVADFQLVNEIAGAGFHGVLQNLCGALWFLGIGNFIRSKRSLLGIGSMVIGGFLILNTIGNLLNIEALSLLGLTANILLGPLWSIWIGITLIRKPL